MNGLAPLGTTQRIVPLAVGVPAVGSYTLNAAEVLNLATTPVYLRDLQTGAVVDLAQQPSYSFTVSNASALITSRFELVFSPQGVLATAPAALAAQVGLYPNPASKVAFIELPASSGPRGRDGAAGGRAGPLGAAAFAARPGCRRPPPGAGQPLHRRVHPAPSHFGRRGGEEARGGVIPAEKGPPV